MVASVLSLLRQRGVATYGALLRDARDLVQHPEVRAALRAAFDQLLVDEFQDTDAVQCDLLRALAFGAAPRPTLFVVGDPKQSIYGWRNADLEAYDAFKRELAREGGELHELTVSQRSVKPILDEVALAIAPIMRPQEGVQAAFQRLEVSERRREEPGFTAGGRAAVEHWIGSQRNAKGEWKEPDARARSEREARALAADLVQLHREHGVRFEDVGVLLRATTELPVVLVQLPTFNERDVLHRVVEAAGALDWPREKLRIQVLDDSTDDSVDIARAAAATLRARGVDAVVLHRQDRTGFKAGALEAGMHASDAEYIAIFDADFVPRPDFLRRAIRPLLADPGLALVQGRWEHLNREENLLTERSRQKWLEWRERRSQQTQQSVP